MDILPIIDWNGSGTLDPDDIAISLAIAEEAEDVEECEDDDIQ